MFVEAPPNIGLWLLHVVAPSFIITTDVKSCSSGTVATLVTRYSHETKRLEQTGADWSGLGRFLMILFSIVLARLS